jgi:hypothetical protein
MIKFILEDTQTRDLLVEICKKASKKKYHFKFIDTENEDLVIAYSLKSFSTKDAKLAYYNICYKH